MITKDLQWPMKGVVRRFGVRTMHGGRQESYPAPWAVNVRGEDNLSHRTRGGSRPGLTKYLGGSQGTIYDLASINTADSGSGVTSRLYVLDSQGFLVTGQQFVYSVTTAGVTKINPKTDTSEALAETEGTIPTQCTFGAVYRDRLIMSGRGDNGIYASRQGDYTDWDYGQHVNDEGRAVVFQLSLGADVGPVPTAMIPNRDSSLICASARSLWVVTGDPTTGQLQRVSDTIGIVGPKAWCRVDDAIVFLSADGLYTMGADGSNLTPLSPESIPNELLDVDTSTTTVSIGYDQDRPSFHIYLRTSGGSDTHWLYELDTKAFWPMRLHNNHSPRAVCSHAGKLLLGGNDGYVRYVGGNNDDGVAIQSHVAIGPFRLAQPGYYGRMPMIHAMLAAGGGNVNWRLVLADSAEEAADNAKLAIEAFQSGGSYSSYVSYSGNWTSGRAVMAYPRVRGVWCVLWLQSTNTWAFEGVKAETEVSGTWRGSSATVVADSVVSPSSSPSGSASSTPSASVSSSPSSSPSASASSTPSASLSPSSSVSHSPSSTPSSSPSPSSSRSSSPSHSRSSSPSNSPSGTPSTSQSASSTPSSSTSSSPSVSNTPSSSRSSSVSGTPSSSLSPSSSVSSSPSSSPSPSSSVSHTPSASASSSPSTSPSNSPSTSTSSSPSETPSGSESSSPSSSPSPSSSVSGSPSSTPSPSSSESSSPSSTPSESVSSSPSASASSSPSTSASSSPSTSASSSPSTSPSASASSSPSASTSSSPSTSPSSSTSSSPSSSTSSSASSSPSSSPSMGDGVAHDAYSLSGLDESGTVSWTHTPVGTPSGALVFVMRTDGSSSDAISGVTYGGTSMTAVSGGLAQDTSGEQGLCKAYFLGSSVPTGAQTVQVTTSAGSYTCVAVTVTSVGNTSVTDVVLLQNDGTLLEQSVDDGSPGSPSVRYAGGYSGQKTPPSVGSNSTSMVSVENTSTSVVACRETTAGQGSRSVGFTSATTDDRAFVHVSVSEV